MNLPKIFKILKEIAKINMLISGEIMPDISLQTDEGKHFSLYDIKNKLIVIFFYLKNNTPTCIKEAESFREIADNAHKLNAFIIGISPNTVESHAKFKKKLNLNYVLLSDPEHVAATAFGVWCKKRVYEKTCMGIVRTTFIVNTNHKIIKVFDKIRAATHGQEVMTFLTNFRGRE